MKKLKILHVGAHDPCGAGFWLSRGINECTKHFAANMRFVDDWSRTPAYIWASKYSQADVKKMFAKADVIHFSDHVKPFFTAFDLDKKLIQQKRVLVYYHGTELRLFHEDLRAEAKEYVPDHVVTLSTPDLFAFVEPEQEAYWLPVVRDFQYIQEKYGWRLKDRKTCRLFGERKLLVIGHPASNVEKKGSKFFFALLTDMMRFNRNIRSSIIINTPWDTAMRKVADFDLLLGNAAPVPSYGLSVVEAGCFKIPAATYMNEQGFKMYEDIVGSRPPVIVWGGMKELFHKLQRLSEDAAAREELGNALHDWIRPLHDTPNVVSRYMQIVLNKK